MKIAVSIFIALFILSACSPLGVDQNRKVTAWGIWCTMAACGVGYWHSERGPGVESEESAKPAMPSPLPKELR